ncbi:MAG: topoisomerase [Oscillospiraceae bacterium]|nr:topoisomerase [Oscillospiraceae bacterium]
METVKNTDLPDLLEHLGYHLKRTGRYYTTTEMDSLMIKDRRTWKRYSSGKGGDAITFLQEFENMGFREAVNYLLDFNGRTVPAISRPRPPPEKEQCPEFTLPPANSDNRRVFAYLRKRGIAPQVIRAFLNAGLLYVVGAKSAPWETPFGHLPLRSLAPPLPTKPEGRLCGGPARAQRSGSRGERRSGEMSESCRLRRGEGYGARDDAMSFCTLNRTVRSNAIALCGLCEGGLNRYLKDHPHLNHVVLCLVNDGPGQEATERLRAEYEGRGLKVSARVPPRGKDWNEYLQNRGPPQERGR